GGIEMLAAARDTLAHRAAKGGFRPAADAVAGGGGDVAAVDHPEWRRDRPPAGVGGVTGGGVAEVAIAERGEAGALLDQRLVERSARRRLDAGDDRLLRPQHKGGGSQN